MGNFERVSEHSRDPLNAVYVCCTVLRSKRSLRRIPMIKLELVQPECKH